MATFSTWLAMTTSPVAAYYFGTVVSIDYSTGDISELYATTTDYNSGKAPWTVNLYRSGYDFFGNAILTPTSVASYTVPATDPGTHAIFDFAYRSVALSDGLTGNFWTVPYGTYTSGDYTQVKMQAYNTNGSKHGGQVTLKLNGTATTVKNLYDIAVSSGADYGNSFIVGYATYDPASSAVQFGYERFSDAGAPINGGVWFSINDGTKHGLDFSAYYTSGYTGAHTPASMLEYRLPVGETAGIHAQLINPDGSFGNVAFDILDRGPNNESAQVIDKYNFLRPSNADPKGDYGVFTQTFGYVDSNLNIHEAVAFETVGTTGTVAAKMQFEVDPSFQPGVLMARVLNGNFVVAYSVSGITYLKEFNAQLVQVGTTLQLPHAAQGIDSLQSLADGRIEIAWRESVTGGKVQHFAIYDTRTTALHFVGDGANDQAAGTVLNDVFTTGSGHDTFYGVDGNDRFNVSSAPLLLDGGTGTDTVVVSGTVVFAASSLVSVEKVSVSDGASANLSALSTKETIRLTSLNGSTSAVVGTSGDDTVAGGAGADRITGGLGADRLTGGAGADVFVYGSAAESTVAAATRDLITDFSGAQGDRIDLTMFGSGTALGFAENAGNTAGTLTLTSGGQHLAIRLNGLFTASGFGLSSDGHGGTLVTYA